MSFEFQPWAGVVVCMRGRSLPSPSAGEPVLLFFDNRNDISPFSALPDFSAP